MASRRSRWPDQDVYAGRACLLAESAARPAPTAVKGLVVSKLPEKTRVSVPAGSAWKNCQQCGGLFPAAPGERRCRACTRTEPSPGGRCGAAHAEDGSPCDGPAGAVRIVDQTDAEVLGCVHHGSALLASVEGVRVYVGPDGQPGDALAAYHQARSRSPFAFDPAASCPGASAGGAL